LGKVVALLSRPVRAEGKEGVGGWVGEWEGRIESFVSFMDHELRADLLDW